MGITGQVGSYETLYGGVPNRIHNVAVVAHLINGKLIAPGATFSFNGATGARTAAKGFLVAPVIINGELSTGLGGGVCQVSTTVFNAAFVAGLPITARTNHALYISHYPLGRDATVDYPDVDLRFVNDTPHWLLLRTFVGADSLIVSLYGTPQHRRVVTQTAPLTATGRMPIAPRLDAALRPGQRIVLTPGHAADHDLGAPLGLCPRRQTALQLDLVLELPGRPRGRARGAAPPSEARPGRRVSPGRPGPGWATSLPAPAAGRAQLSRAGYGPSGPDPCPVSIADRSQAGVRVARSVAASTVPCAVHPSAMSVPPRSTAYSKRKRAPRISTQRA